MFLFKQKTAYEMRISDWSSDVCASDLQRYVGSAVDRTPVGRDRRLPPGTEDVEQDRHHNQQDQDDRYRHDAAPNPCVHKKRRMKAPFAIRDGDRASAPLTLPWDVASITRHVRPVITSPPHTTGEPFPAEQVASKDPG